MLLPRLPTMAVVEAITGEKEEVLFLFRCMESPAMEEERKVVVVVETIRTKVEVTKTMVVKMEVVHRRVNMVVVVEEETRMVTVTMERVTTITTGVKKEIQWVELVFNL